jgi:hypothetical protein
VTHAEPRAPGAGLQLLLDLLWGQEITHELVLAELFRHTDLARTLGLWRDDGKPRVIVEPDRGMFDLALRQPDGSTTTFVELKFGAESGRDQRARQRAWAEAVGADRAYILLGTSFFEIEREPSVHYIGVPELLDGLAFGVAEGALSELRAVYADRLQRDAALWSGVHDPASASPIAILRLYREIADAWPVDVNPYRATNPGGPDWILNADAWTTLPVTGWEQATFYWEIAGGRVRFKLGWEGPETDRRQARDAYERALLDGARDVGIAIERTRRVSGRFMSAAQFPRPVRDDVLIDGVLSVERARQLYDDATAVFEAALRHLQPLPMP